MAGAESEQSRRVITDKEVICNIGTARYRLATALNNQYSVSNDFYYAVKNLPTTATGHAEDPNTIAYKRFIDDWGTVSGDSLGGGAIANVFHKHVVH